MKIIFGKLIDAGRQALRLASLLTALGVALACDRPAPPQAAPQPEPYAWARDNRLVAHALGGIDNKFDYTNSREAFLFNYARGLRIFEIDLASTRDGRLVALHYWIPEQLQKLGIQVPPGETPPLTHGQFMRSKILGRFTPLDVDGVVALLQSHPDAWLVTDNKITSGPEMRGAFEQLIAAANKTDPTVLDRIAPQLYNQAMLPELKALYPFRAWVYTLYQSKDNDDEVLRFVTANNIRVVTMADSRANARPGFLARLKASGVYTYVHTINDKALARTLLAKGAHGFYTDFLAPADLTSQTQRAGG